MNPTQEMREAYLLETYKMTEEELRNSMTLFSAVALINAYNAASAAATARAVEKVRALKSDKYGPSWDGALNRAIEQLEREQ